jgi:hypothetical protein
VSERAAGHVSLWDPESTGTERRGKGSIKEGEDKRKQELEGEKGDEGGDG